MTTVLGSWKNVKFAIDLEREDVWQKYRFRGDVPRGVVRVKHLRYQCNADSTNQTTSPAALGKTRCAIFLIRYLTG